MSLLGKDGPIKQNYICGQSSGDIRESEVEDLFYKYGPVVDIDLKIPPRPPGYAFVEFEDSHDAEDAIRGRDDYNFDGSRLWVELGMENGDHHHMTATVVEVVEVVAVELLGVLTTEFW